MHISTNNLHYAKCIYPCLRSYKHLWKIDIGKNNQYYYIINLNSI